MQNYMLDSAKDYKKKVKKEGWQGVWVGGGGGTRSSLIQFNYLCTQGSPYALYSVEVFPVALPPMLARV